MILEKLRSIPQHTHFTLNSDGGGAWTDIAGILALLVAVGIGFFTYDLSDFRLWLSVVLAMVYLMLTWGIEFDELGWLRNLKIGLLALIPLTLILLGVNGWAAILMLFVLCATVMYTLPERNGYIWIGILCLFIVLVYLTIWADDGDLFVAFGTVAGFLFIGSAASGQVKALEAEQKSRHLLQQLQNAHQQLQERADQAEELAITNERNRLAREVHDTLGHQLTVAAVQLEGAQKLIDREPQKAMAMVGTVREQILEGLSELRRTVSALRAPIEEDLSLPSALPRLVQNFESATNIKTELSITNELPELSGQQRHALYRAAQELLTNIQKHAQASHAWINLSAAGGHTTLAVEDNGRGIQNGADTTGFGLRGLRERVTQVGGTVSFDNRTGSGTAVTVSLPVSELDNGRETNE